MGSTVEFCPPSLLIASPHLQDDEYKQAVVLLLDHTPRGATGLTINRPSDLPLQDFLQVEGVRIPADVRTWNGGPDDQGKGVILHNKPRKVDKDQTFALAANDSALRQLIKAGLTRSPNSVRYPYRFLIGCQTWYADQLDCQLRRGDWMQLETEPSILFNVDAQEMWLHALAVIGITPAKIIPQPQMYPH